jgi:hypothetical protein
MAARACGEISSLRKYQIMHMSRSLGRFPGPAILTPRSTLGTAALRTLRSAGGGIGRALRRLRANAQARQARAAFLTMPHHILRDIGFSHLEGLAPIAREQSSWSHRL